MWQNSPCYQKDATDGFSYLEGAVSGFKNCTSGYESKNAIINREKSFMPSSKSMNL